MSGEVDVHREAQGDKVNSHVVHQLFESCASVSSSFFCDLSGKFLRSLKVLGFMYPNQLITENLVFTRILRL